MGYDLHITRADEWSESESRPISLEEWLAVVADDPELHRDPADANSQWPGFVYWADPSQPVEEWWQWLCHERGEIVTKSPDAPLRRKMHELAARLGARVLGDDGEEYGADGQPVDRPLLSDATTMERLLRWTRPLRRSPFRSWRRGRR